MRGCLSTVRRRAISLAVLVLIVPSPAAAQDEQRPNCISIQLGPQFGISEYRTHFKLAASYARWIGGLFSLDLAAGVLTAKNTDLMLSIGTRWRFVHTHYGLDAYARWGLETTQLFRAENRVAISGRASAVAAYYSFSQKVALTAEIAVALGPALGGGAGARLAAALDILAGVEIPF